MNIDFARRQMIEQQVRAWDVYDDDVLDVLGMVSRERFVPPEFRALAYADAEIPIGFGECILTPTINGRILDALDIGGNDDVLVVGAGSGYLTACVGELARSVTAIDIREEFVSMAESNLAAADIDNAVVVRMDASQELPDGRFDAIAVTGSIDAFDTRYAEALKPGGRLFVAVGTAPVMEARRISRDGDSDWSAESLFETCLRPLIHGTRPPAFEF